VKAIRFSFGTLHTGINHLGLKRFVELYKLVAPPDKTPQDQTFRNWADKKKPTKPDVDFLPYVRIVCGLKSIDDLYEDYDTATGGPIN